jgi:two-component system OmpR family response regulator
MRVLVVEDEASIAAFVAGGLRQEGYAVDVADNGVDGLELAQSQPYDAAVVDVMLPRLDGLSLVAALRRADVSLPVLFLSARHSVDDRVRGLQAGGDDYLTKPFAFPELLARLQALTRRGHLSLEPDAAGDCRSSPRPPDPACRARRRCPSSCGRASSPCSSS